MLPIPKVLLFVCDASEKAVLQRALAPHAELTWVCSPQEVAQQLEKVDYDVVFCARTLFMGSWREVLEEVQLLNPNLPVIVLSQTASATEWEDVLAAGAFDLLAPARDERALLSVMEHAVVSHEARLWHGHDIPQTAKVS